MRGASAPASQEPPPELPSPDLPGRAARIYDDCETTVARGREVYDDAGAVLLSLRRMLRDGTCPAIESRITQLIETIGGFRSSVNDLNWCGLEIQQHVAEHRVQLEKALAEIPLASAIFQAGVQAGLGQAVQQQAARPRPRSRHARPSRLQVVATTVATSGVAASLATGAWTVSQDTGSVHHFAAVSPAAVMRIAPPDMATLVPSASPSHSLGGSATAAKKASPVVTPSPSAPAPPPASQAAPPPAVVQQPALTVSVSDLQLSGTTATFTLAATGDAVDWSVSTDIPGARLDVEQGVLSSAQAPVTITLTDPLGLMGTVFVKWDGGGVAAIRVWPSAGGAVQGILPSVP